MGRRRTSRIILLGLCLWGFLGCERTAPRRATSPPQNAPDAPAAQPQQPPLQERAGRTRITVGNTPLWVEVADTPAALQQGLMFRASLPEDEGMLFAFPYPGPQSFWMENTTIPLDIAFIDPDRAILNILAMKPLDTGPRYESAGPAQYALEVNQGWFARHGIKAGDRVSFR